MTTFLANRDIYTSVICDLVPQTRVRLWIATADIKDMYVDVGGRDMVPFLTMLDRMRWQSGNYANCVSHICVRSVILKRTRKISLRMPLMPGNRAHED